MRKILAALAFTLLLIGPALAQVPYFPKTVPANTVLGRLGVPSTGGPVVAVPISSLASASLALNNGMIYVGNASNLAVGLTLSGDCTITNTAVITCTKTNGVSFAASATTDATNAANITSGTLPAARLPNPSASTLGGIQSLTCGGSTWVSALSTLGVLSCTQPAFSNISGTATPSQLPLATSSTAGTVPASGGVSTNCLHGDFTWNSCGGAGGSPGGTSGQIEWNSSGAFAGFTMSGDCTIVTSTGVITCTKTNGASFAASATTDTTNATNISSGSLALGRIASISNNTVLGNVSGISAAPSALTATQVTTLCNQATTTLTGCVPATGTPSGKFLKDNMTWASTTSGSCILAGVYCVSTNTNFAGAVAAAVAAGGGVVLVDQNVTISTAQAIGANVRVTCVPGITIATSSATADLMDFTGALTWLDHCALAFNGTGPKTAGYLANVTGTENHISHVTISDVGSGGCFICIRENGIIGYVDNVTINANAHAVSGTSGCVVEDTGSEILMLSNFTCGSGNTNPYQFAVKVISGALNFSNLELLQTNYALWVAPSAGVSAFVKGGFSYFDNCAAVCLNIQPASNTGTVGYVDIQGTEIAPNSSIYQAVVIDQATNGGNITDMHINDGQIFNYQANANQAIVIAGTLISVTITGASIGNNYTTGILINGSTQFKLNAHANDIVAGTNCIVSVGALSSAPIFLGNRCNGKTLSWGGSSTANVSFNP